MRGLNYHPTTQLFLLQIKLAFQGFSCFFLPRASLQHKVDCSVKDAILKFSKISTKEQNNPKKDYFC